ncbi:hypothetical protein KFE25_006432 [Diacronema lutheri]|uniref:tRNA (guanine(10)-N(2))-methyltransferase n=1 Tax=Diacronema lutheri TaxID=2081491 RepID=A0A8J5XWK4_DIALT|nr:hypothetical protein KFE25_006432 [Diacronema lutheri]
MAPYLVHFTHKWLAFRVPELEAVAQLMGIELALDDESAREELRQERRGVIGDPARRREAEARERADVVVHLRSDDDARRLASRLVLVQSIVALWGSGRTWDEVLARCAASAHERIEPYLTEDRTFRVRVEAFGCKYQTRDAVALMQTHLARLELKGTVRLKKPDNTVLVYVDHGMSGMPTPATPPRGIHVGRRIARAPGLSHADKFRLPDRRFLGPTSLDHQLSMVIANQAHARPGALVLDPFCGTASILVGCAAFGARVLGADLDARNLVGKGEGRTIWANFAQYGFAPPLGLLRADFSAASTCWRHVPFLDAIVCDPPYGVRASSKKLADGASDLLHEPGHEEHVPMRERLNIEPLLDALLAFAASRLVIGGRLVFLLPTTTDMRGSAAPEHPALELRAESEQPISSRWCRRLVTMVKVRECAPGMHVSFERRAASLFDTAKLGRVAPSADSRRAARAARAAHARTSADVRARARSGDALARWPRVRALALVVAALVVTAALALAARRRGAAR